MKKVEGRFRRGAAAFWCGLSGLALVSMAVAAPPPPGVFVAEAKATTFVDRVEALGTLRANESVTLTSPITETITAIHFDDGDRVSAGKVLVELNSAEQRALLEEARAQVEEAKAQYDRVKSLAVQGTAAQSLVDERRRDWDTARARSSAIEARLNNRLVRAPFSGVLGFRSVSVGALVEPADVIATLDDDSVMKLEFAVPSVYIAALRIGLEVTAETSAYPGRSFAGQVTSVDSRIDPVTRAVQARATIANKDRVLKPGMLMKLELRSAPRQSVAIPERALGTQGREQFVLVVNTAEGNRIERRSVRIGVRQTGIVEVVEGLAAGEKIVSDGALKVRPGMNVEILAADDGQSSLPELLGNKTSAGAAP